MFPSCRLRKKRLGLVVGQGKISTQQYVSLFKHEMLSSFLSGCAEKIQTDIYKQVSLRCPFSARCFRCSGNEELECWEAAVGISSLEQ